MESKYFTRHFSSDLMQSNIPQSKNNLLNGSSSLQWPQESRRGAVPEPRRAHPSPFPTPRCGFRVIFHSTRIPVSHPFTWHFTWLHKTQPPLRAKNETALCVGPPPSPRPPPRVHPMLLLHPAGWVAGGGTPHLQARVAELLIYFGFLKI